jgi:hypothetical protein
MTFTDLLDIMNNVEMIVKIQWLTNCQYLQYRQHIIFGDFSSPKTLFASEKYEIFHSES